MHRFYFCLLPLLGLASAQDFMSRKCMFVKREIESGHKDYLTKQHWYPRLAARCRGVPGAELPEPAVPAIPAAAASSFPSHHISFQVPLGGGNSPVKTALTMAKTAMASKQGAEIKTEAEKLAMTAKSAFEHQDTEELKEGATEFMDKLKGLWEKNANPDMKRKAALLLNKAKKTLQENGMEELPEKAMGAESQLEEKLEAVKELAGGQGGLDLAKLAGAAKEGHLQNKATELLKMAMQKPETEAIAQKAAATLQTLKSAGFSQEALQELAAKAGAKPGFAIHV